MLPDIAYEYEERAAIKEFDAGMKREKAEREALLDIKKAKWLITKGETNEQA
jgi:hypothetical protein